MYRHGTAVARAARKMCPLSRRETAKMCPRSQEKPEPLAILRRPRVMETISMSADTLFLQFATAFALCAIACGLILAGRMTIRRAADSEKWPVVPGVVLESGVTAVREESGQRFRPT